MSGDNAVMKNSQIKVLLMVSRRSLGKRASDRNTLMKTRR
jgi:hypothetical protein